LLEHRCRSLQAIGQVRRALHRGDSPFLALARWRNRDAAETT
jgi:hypothetical protein